jgi:hypothetical protein
MKMIWHQAPGKYLATIRNISLAKFNKMKVVTIASKNWLFVVASVMDMI